MNIPINDDYDDLFTLYWIRKLYKNPYIEKYIAGSSTCSTKELYIAMVSAVKEGLQSYCVSVIKYIHVVTSIECDPFWKTINNLLYNFNFRTFKNNSTLCTAIPHEKLKTRLKEIIHKVFYFKIVCNI